MPTTKSCPKTHELHTHAHTLLTENQFYQCDIYGSHIGADADLSLLCRCVKKIRFVCSHKTQLSAKLSLFLSYDMFPPTITAIVRLYMKPLTHMP